MQNSGESSILHRLARTFGQGLAFGVGMTLTQKALRPDAPKPAPAPARMPEIPPAAVQPPAAAQLPAEPAPPRPAPAPAAAPAPRSQFDLRAIQAIVSVVEQRLKEQASHTEVRLAETESGLSARIHEMVRRQVETEIAGLRGQVIRTQREFAEAVGRVVADQVAKEVAARTAAMEAAVERRIEAAVEAAVAPLRAELAELRRRLAASERTIEEFTDAVGDSVRIAAERSAILQPDRETVAQSEPAPAPHTVARRPARMRAERAPQHLDLRVVRQRLMAAERRDDIPRAAFPPAAVPRKAPVVVRFPVAS
jgi:hypothetical protein